MEISFVIQQLESITDPRTHLYKNAHKLSDILMIALCANLAGCDDWVETQEFGNEKIEWFSTFLELKNGSPSHDTFGRIFAILDPNELSSVYRKLLDSFKLVDEKIVAIDGKTLRGSHDKSSGVKPIHMVSAWSTQNSLVLGQVKTDEKSNEITAIPELLDVISIKGATVTIDAIGAQKTIVRKIVEKKANYIIGLKKNQRNLYGSVVEKFSDIDLDTSEGELVEGNVAYYRTQEHSRNRQEIRAHYVIDDLSDVANTQAWAIQTVCMVIAQVTRPDGKVSIERRYFISSLGLNAKEFATGIRSHWEIENSLHWVLDIAFREDESRVRKNNSAQNLAIIRHLTLAMLKRDTKTKAGIKTKRHKAGWSTNYLLERLFDHSA